MKKEKINYKRILLTTILFTVSAIFVVFLINISLLYFVFPYEFANFCYSMGFDNSSANLYYKDYLKTKNINTCYKALNLKIKCADYDMIVEIYEEFAGHEDYLKFMSKLEDINEMLDDNIFEQSVILNESNFLHKEYIKAMNELDKDEAFEKAVEVFYLQVDKDLKNNGVYALDVFIKEGQPKDKFLLAYNSDSSLLFDMQEYFNSLLEIFENNKQVNTNVEKAYLVALGNKLITVGNNINVIYSEKGINNDLENLNNSNMLNVNAVIKQILLEG